MKAKIDIKGCLWAVAETELEAYALMKWQEAYGESGDGQATIRKSTMGIDTNFTKNQVVDKAGLE